MNSFKNTVTFFIILSFASTGSAFGMCPCQMDSKAGTFHKTAGSHMSQHTAMPEKTPGPAGGQCCESDAGASSDSGSEVSFSIDGTCCCTSLRDVSSAKQPVVRTASLSTAKNLHFQSLFSISNLQLQQPVASSMVSTVTLPPLPAIFLLHSAFLI